MEIIIIAAMAANRVIGRDNGIPWKIPGEQARFRTATMGYPLIMGRRTFESIGRPLAGRTNIVVSRDRAYQVPGCRVCHSLEHALETCHGRDRVFIIGGGQLYSQGLSRADTLLLTVLDKPVAGDTLFPEFAEDAFVLVDRERVSGPVPYTVETWRRRLPADQSLQEEACKPGV